MRPIIVPSIATAMPSGGPPGTFRRAPRSCNARAKRSRFSRSHAGQTSRSFVGRCAPCHCAATRRRPQTRPHGAPVHRSARPGREAARPGRSLAPGVTSVLLFDESHQLLFGRAPGPTRLAHEHRRVVIASGTSVSVHPFPPLLQRFERGPDSSRSATFHRPSVYRLGRLTSVRKRSSRIVYSSRLLSLSPAASAGSRRSRARPQSLSEQASIPAYRVDVGPRCGARWRGWSDRPSAQRDARGDQGPARRFARAGQRVASEPARRSEHLT